MDRDAKVILEDDSMEDEVRRVLFQNDVAEETQEPQDGRTRSGNKDTNWGDDTTGDHQPDKHDAFQTVPYQQGSRKGVHFHYGYADRCACRKNL